MLYFKNTCHRINLNFYTIKFLLSPKMFCYEKIGVSVNRIHHNCYFFHLWCFGLQLRPFPYH